MRRYLLLNVLVAMAIVLASCGDDSSNIDNGNPRPTPIVDNIVVPPEWSGQWNLVLTFRDCNSNHIVTVEDVVDNICVGDTLSLGYSPILNQCDGLIDGDRIDVGCEHAFIVEPCNVDVMLLLDLDRDGDTITGSGVWTVERTGLCTIEYEAGCERIEVTGTRLDPNPVECDGGSASSLFGSLGVRARLFVEVGPQ